MPDEAVGQYANEPPVACQLSLEALTNDGWQSFPARIADLTRQELWVRVDRKLAEPLDPGRSVRLLVRHPERPTQIAETLVLWHIGKTGNMVVLKRPGLWDPPSRREHMRARLAVPVYLRADEESDPVPATTIDIGVGGLFCLATMDLRIGQRIDVAVQLTPGQTFECEAEVARLDVDPDDPMGMQLKVGLHFLGLNTEGQVSLAEVIVSLARDVDDKFVPRPWREDLDGLLPFDAGDRNEAEAMLGLGLDASGSGSAEFDWMAHEAIGFEPTGFDSIGLIGVASDRVEDAPPPADHVEVAQCLALIPFVPADRAEVEPESRRTRRRRAG